MASFSSLRYPSQRGPGSLWFLILYGVPLTNLAVHLAWLLALHPALASLPLSSLDRRRLADFMNRNFMLRPENFRPLTLLTSAFSHVQPLHLLVNMSTYNTYARTLYTLGTSPLRFALLALGSAVAAGASFVLNAQRRRGKGKRSISSSRPETAAVGASGILTGLGTALAIMFPALKVRVSGTNVVLPLRAVLVGMFAVDAYCLGAERDTGVGHAGHLGGALFGLAYALARKSLRHWNL